MTLQAFYFGGCQAAKNEQNSHYNQIYKRAVYKKVKHGGEGVTSTQIIFLA